MVQNIQISPFLKVSITNSLTTKTQCEVLAVASQGKSSFILSKDFNEYNPILKKLLSTSEFSLKSTSLCLVRFAGKKGGEHLLLVSPPQEKEGVNALGSLERIRRTGALIVQKCATEKIESALIHFPTFFQKQFKFEVDFTSGLCAFIEGAALSLYQFKKYFSKKEDNLKPLAITLVCSQNKNQTYINGLKTACAYVSGAEICRDLGNEPSNVLFPEELAKRSKQLAQKHGIKAVVLDDTALKKEKAGLILGVGQGAANPPRLIHLEYLPPQKSHNTIAFVGKGITFDSGGISIKPSSKMEDMKYDMCGAAAVIGALVTCAQLKLKTKIIAVVAAAENMPDGKAIQPGNILYSRSGKTVEVNNTDAEGRLVLADALDYVQDLSPNYIIDLATLTGAAMVTLGKASAALLGNNPQFNKLVQSAAKQSGERVWEMPLFEEYFEDLKSEYADMRNTGDIPGAGTAKGALFLKQFIRKGVKWAHLDIASMAYSVPGIPYYPKKSSTGFGVRLLVELAKNLS